MFEELNAHRAAVAENIQKGMEIGFTGGELEKAHKVGDIHPNGKWVWTQLPSGKYDWRVIKKTGAGSGAGSSSTAQKTAKKEAELKEFINIFKQIPNERHLENMDVDELKRFRDAAHKCWLDDENLNRYTRLRCKEWRDLAKKEIASKDEEARATQKENEYRKHHPNSTTKNSDIKQQAETDNKEGKKEAEASKLPKVKLSEKNFKKGVVEKDEYTSKNAIDLHDYTGESIEYYTNNGEKKKAQPYISEFYAFAKQDAVGGYEAYFDRADSIGTFRTLKDAVSALEDWINKVRVKGHAKPKWVYNAKNGVHQKNYQLD